ncbi:MAG: alpha/beta hydrolase [Clostridia bacterium]|nr:alpha/beta hydrolase [Clostridia bacterium]MBR5426938.1 alpha/beta hydrolase [Clostridia bacterium]
MANVTAKKILKSTAITAAAVGGASFAFCELAFEIAMTSRGMKRRLNTINIEPAERDYYRAHPDQINDDRIWYDCTDHEDLRLVSSHGENLFADYLPSTRESHNYAFCIHGWTSCPKNMSYQAKHYYELGWNVLLPHMKGHGKSEEKVVGMGWPDRFDVIDWITYFVDRDPDAKILLIGSSMGSATVMNVTGERLPDNVKVAISDCGFTTAWDIFTNTLKERIHLPAEPLMSTMRLVTRLHAGFDIKKANPIDQIKKSKTPTMFFHGEEDNFIPCRMMYELYEAEACEDKECLAIPDADHTEACTAHPEMFWPAADSFVSKFMDLNG